MAISNWFCQQRESNPGRLRSKRVRYPLHYCLSASSCLIYFLQYPTYCVFQVLLSSFLNKNLLRIGLQVVVASSATSPTAAASMTTSHDGPVSSDVALAQLAAEAGLLESGEGSMIEVIVALLEFCPASRLRPLQQCISSHGYHVVRSVLSALSVLFQENLMFSN